MNLSLGMVTLGRVDTMLWNMGFAFSDTWGLENRIFIEVLLAILRKSVLKEGTKDLPMLIDYLHIFKPKIEQMSADFLR